MEERDRQLDRLLGEIKRGRPSPVYLLHGKEDFLVGRAREAIVEGLQAQAGGEVESMDGREAPLGAVMDVLLEISLFASRRIVVVRHAEALAPGSPPEIQALRQAAGCHEPEGNILILSAAQAFDKRTRLYKTLSSVGAICQFESLRGRTLLGGVESAARRRGLAITAEAADALVARAGTSLRQIDLEMEKISLWVSPKNEVTPEDVAAVVPRSKEDVIFDLTGALGDRRVAAALRHLRELRFHGATPLMILSMLGREVRFLLQAKLMGGVVGRVGWTDRMAFEQFSRAVWPKIKSETEVPAGNPKYHILGANPYVAFLVLRRARQFSMAELERGLTLIGRTDLVLKSTTQSPDALLEKLVIQLAAGNGA